MSRERLVRRGGRPLGCTRVSDPLSRLGGVARETEILNRFPGYSAFLQCTWLQFSVSGFLQTSLSMVVVISSRKGFL